VSVIPAIESVVVSQGELTSMPHNKFRSEWENWMKKVRGSHFKAHRKSGLYANMGFEISSVAATALCLAHVSHHAGFQLLL